MSIAEKFNIPPALFETIKKMNAEETEYQEKVKALLKKKGFTSIGQMSPEEKKDFFNTLDIMHKAKNEEVEEIDEVSKSKLGDYVRKAMDDEQQTRKRADSAEKSSKEVGKSFMKDRQDALIRQADKRRTGINRAITKLSKEEVELDEAFPKSTQYALVHSSSKKIVAKGNKKEMTKKVKELNAKEKGSHYVGISYGSKVGDTFGFGPSPADKLSVRNEEVEKLDEVKVGDKVHLGLKQKGGSGMRGTVHKIEGDKVHVNLGKEKFGDRIVTGSMKNVTKEEVELEEAKSSTGYDLYHKDFSSAMAHAYDFAKKKYNIEIDPLEIDRNVAMGPRKPGSGKANAYRLLDKTGKKAIQVQVANLDNKRYELNMYKEDVDQIVEVKVGDKVSFSHSVAAAGGRSVKKTGTVHQIDGDTVHVKVKDKYGVMTHKKKASDLMKEDVEQIDELKKSTMASYINKAAADAVNRPAKGNKRLAGIGMASKKLAGTPKKLESRIEDVIKEIQKHMEFERSYGHESIDNPDFMKVISMLKKGNVDLAVRYAMNLDSDPRDFLLTVMEPIGSLVGKRMREEVELTEKVSPAQIDRMRQEYDKIKGIDPASDNYKKLTTMLDKLDLKTLQTLAGAKIKFVSGLAQNRVVRKMNEEVEELDEISADVAKRVAQRRDQDFRKNTPTDTQKRRMSRGNWRADPQLQADKARQSAEKRGAKDVYDYNKKEEVEFDEASNPQISMKRAGLSVDRAKEVMRHQKEIGTIRKKREALRNSYDPAIIEAYKKMKKKNEVTKDDNKIIKSSDKLSGKQEPIELDPELKEQKR
jgi:hypothetical protein